MKKALLIIALSLSSQLMAEDNFKTMEKIGLNKFQQATLLEIKKEDKDKNKKKLSELAEILDLTELQMKKLYKFSNNKKEH